MPSIKAVYEHERGCGFRKPGGFYLRTGGKGFPCKTLPIPFLVCECCGFVPGPSRNYQWLRTQYLKATLKKDPCTAKPAFCEECPINLSIFQSEKLALDWVGSKYYDTPDKFNLEAANMGISRRFSAKVDEEGNIQGFGLKDFKVGEHWIALAHKKAVTGINEEGEAVATPGIFKLWRPEIIEYVIRDTDSEAYLEKLEEQGVTLIKVIPVEDKQADLFE